MHMYASVTAFLFEDGKYRKWSLRSYVIVLPLSFRFEGVDLNCSTNRIDIVCYAHEMTNSFEFQLKSSFRIFGIGPLSHPITIMIGSWLFIVWNAASIKPYVGHVCSCFTVGSVSFVSALVFHTHIYAHGPSQYNDKICSWLALLTCSRSISNAAAAAASVGTSVADTIVFATNEKERINKNKTTK